MTNPSEKQEVQGGPKARRSSIGSSFTKGAKNKLGWRGKGSSSKNNNKNAQPASTRVFEPSNASSESAEAVAASTATTTVAAKNTPQSVMNNLFVATSTAPVNMVKGFGNVVVGAGTVVVTTTQKASYAVVDAGTMVGNRVVDGGKAFVDGTTMVVGTTTSAVNKGARGVGKGALDFANTIKKPFHQSLLFGLTNQKKSKSKWEEGIEVIDEVLDSSSDAYRALSEDQRRRLANVKKILLNPGTKKSSAAHIPQELIEMQGLRPDIVETMGYEDMNDLDARAPAQRRANRRKSSIRSSNFTLQEYAGVKNDSALDRLIAELDEEDSECDGKLANDTSTPVDARTASTADHDTDSNGSSTADVDPPTVDVDKYFVPPEFTAIPKNHQKELMEMLDWESIGKWNFDIFRLNDISNGHPLLFMGWAILGSPYAQQAMAKELGLDASCVNDNPKGKYTFIDDLLLPADKLCNYMRVIESDYSKTNPYHNAIHAADVLQSLHALVQNSLEEDFMRDCPQINLFAILLAAVVHDVDHPGVTNAFHVKVKSELAVLYNDQSVLENWHVAHAFARLLDRDLAKHESIQANQVAILSAKNEKNSPNNILCNAKPQQFLDVRKRIIEAVLHTDMTSHFESVSAARGMLMVEDGMDKKERQWQLLMFMLHLADISGQAKGGKLFLLWTDRCMEEFFQQGDEETKLGLPISPNCDRKTVLPAESQCGFIQFVIAPAYEVLGLYSSFVQETIIPQIHSNHAYWVSQSEVSTTSASEIEEEEVQNDTVEPKIQPAASVAEC